MVLLLAGSSIRVITQFERGVVLRFGQLRAGRPGARARPPRADRRPPAQGQHADRHDAGPRPGRHHPRQRHRPRRRRRLLPRPRPGQGRRRRAELPTRHRPGRPSLPALHHRQERPRRPAVQPRTTQPGPRTHARQPRTGLGRADRPRRDQRRRPTRDDETVHVAPSRGRTRTPLPRHHRRRRAAGLRRSSPKPPRS